MNSLGTIPIPFADHEHHGFVKAMLSGEAEYSFGSLLRLAYIFGNMSPDPRTRNGAVLLDENERPAVGAYNRVPKGLDNPSRHLKNPETKARYIEHAERAVLYRAARTGFATEGRTLVCPWAACPDCARAIIASGIAVLVVHKPLIERTPGHWQDAVTKGLEMLIEAGVEIVRHEGLVGDVETRFDGKDITP